MFNCYMQGMRNKTKQNKVHKTERKTHKYTHTHIYNRWNGKGEYIARNIFRTFLPATSPPISNILS